MQASEISRPATLVAVVTIVVALAAAALGHLSVLGRELGVRDADVVAATPRLTAQVRGLETDMLTWGVQGEAWLLAPADYARSDILKQKAAAFAAANNLTARVVLVSRGAEGAGASWGRPILTAALGQADTLNIASADYAMLAKAFAAEGHALRLPVLLVDTADESGVRGTDPRS